MRNVSHLYKSSELLTREDILLQEVGLLPRDFQEFQKSVMHIAPEEADKLAKSLLEESIIIDQAIGMIKNGANVNYADSKKGDFLLLKCCRRKFTAMGYDDLFRYLILAGANVNQKNNYGTTALMAAARHNMLIEVKVLIALGADVNAKCKDGDTALFSAIMHGNKECAQYLIEHGAIINGHNNAGNDMFSLPKKRENKDLDKYINSLSSEETTKEYCEAVLGEAQKVVQECLNDTPFVKKRTKNEECK